MVKANLLCIPEKKTFNLSASYSSTVHHLFFPGTGSGFLEIATQGFILVDYNSCQDTSMSAIKITPLKHSLLNWWIGSKIADTTTIKWGINIETVEALVNQYWIDIHPLTNGDTREGEKGGREGRSWWGGGGERGGGGRWGWTAPMLDQHIINFISDGLGRQRFLIWNVFGICQYFSVITQCGDEKEKKTLATN